MNFVELIKPHLVSNDILIQEFVLHTLYELPDVPEDWVNSLLREAFKNKEKQTSIFMYLEKQVMNEEAVQLLIEYLPKVDKSNIHLSLRLLDQVEPELALKYKNSLQYYISEDSWNIYELIMSGTEEEVYTEYAKLLNSLESADEFHYAPFLKAKKLAACLVKKGWITETDLDIIFREELTQPLISYNGILSIYMAGLLKLDKYTPLFAPLLVMDDDILLEEVSGALIHFQSDEVVKVVAPYLQNSEAVIYASSIIETIKTEAAVQALREAYQNVTEEDEQDFLFEALCHQLSLEALPEIKAHMEKEYFTGLVEIEQVVYSYYSILGLSHPDIEWWRDEALGLHRGREMEFINETFPTRENRSDEPMRKQTKIGRNDPCPCGSGKKFKKCCSN